MPRKRSAPSPEDPAWSDPNLREPRYSQSLERGLAILACFTPARPVLGIADIADSLGMSRSTTHRYVITLVALGYLEQGASRKYRLGLRVTDLGMAALSSTGLREHAHAYLQELRERTSCTAGIGVLDGTEVVFVDRVQSFRRGRPAADIEPSPGARLPAYCTAMGKLLLAHLPEGEQGPRVSALRPSRRTPTTITSKRALREQLRELQGASLAVNDGELTAGLYAIAAPVRDGGREVVAAVGLAAPAASIPLREMVDALGPHLIAAADRISSRLGYRREDERTGPPGAPVA